MCALVTGVQTCALPIYDRAHASDAAASRLDRGCSSGGSSRVACGADFQSTLRIVAQGGGDRGGFGGVGTGVRRARRGERPALGGSSGHAADSVLARTPCQRRRTRLPLLRSEEHTSELQSLMRISYAVFCLKKNKK